MTEARLSAPQTRLGVLRRVRRSVRGRILAAILGLLVLGVVITGFELAVTSLARVEARIDEALAAKVAELRTIVEDGDPETGEPWTSLDEALLAGIERQVPQSNITVLALVDGRVTYRPRDVASGERDGAAVDAALEVDLAGVDGPVLGSTQAAGQSLRWAVLPVQVQEGAARGLLVAVSEVAPVREEAWGLLRSYALSSAVTLVVVGLAGWVVAGRLLRPLRDLQATAERITDSDLSERITVSGEDEISALSRTFNGMLDRLEGAFADQRVFLDDAGHELRTPLTIVSGHLQVMDPTDTTDVEQTRDVVMDEVDRMSRLVDDLILLAKSERPDFVHPAPLRVADLVDSVLRTAQPLAARAWGIDEQADLVVHADQQRLTQALLALVANAVRHTEDGAVIALGSRMDGDGVRLWVRDTGPGIPPDERAAVFDRFHRASNTRGEGTGLGLSIVAAIADAHHGRAWAQEAPGSGAMLCLWIPASEEV